MFCAALLLLAPCPQTPTNVQIDGIMNGNFEHLSIDGKLGATQQRADGSYWCGAETLTTTDSTGNRFLEFPAGAARFVSQRVGVMRDHATSPVIELRVKLQGPGHEARVTVVEGNWDVFPWVTGTDVGVIGPAPTYTATGYYPQWTMFEKANDWPGWKQIEPVGTAGGLVVEGAPTGPICLGNNQFSRNKFLTLRTVVATPKLVITWTAPHDGWVRVLGRPYLQNDTVSGTSCEVFLESNPSGDPHAPPPDVIGGANPLLVSGPLALGDHNGPELITRLHVTAGQRVHFQTSAPNIANPCPDSIYMYWAPTVFYEGQRITYRIGNQLPSMSNLPDEKFLARSYPTSDWNKWVTYTLPAGVDFESAYSIVQSPKRRPWGPIDVVLSAPATNQHATRFDSVKCWTELETMSEADLRLAMRDHVTWVYDNDLLLRDRGNQPPASTPPPWQAGQRPSPYVTRGMKISSGPISTPGLVEYPAYVEPMLNWRYDTTDYEDTTWIAQSEVKQVIHGAAGIGSFVAGSYDTPQDAFVLPTGHKHTFASGAIRVLDGYRIWGDVEFLDRAFEVGKIIAEHGVMNDISPAGQDDPRNGLIVLGGYEIDLAAGIATNSTTTDVTTLPKATEFMDGTLSLIEGYVAIRQYNLQHPSGTPRYDPAELDEWRVKIENSLTILAGMRGFIGAEFRWSSAQPLPPGASNLAFSHFGVWSDDWHDLGWEGSDTTGYRSGDAMGAYDLLTSFASLGIPPSQWSAEQALADYVMTNLILEPMDHFLGLFEQNCSRNSGLPGDNPRLWDKYRYLIDKNFGDVERYRKQMVAAGLCSLKFQYTGPSYAGDPPAETIVGGIWTGGGQLPYQIHAQYSFAPGLRVDGACGFFFEGAAMALASAVPNSPDRSKLAAIVYSVFKSNESFFRNPHGDPLPFGYIPKVTTLPPHNQKSGGEAQTTEAAIRIDPWLDPTAPANTNRPTVTVTPASPIAPPTSTTPFTIRVQFPEVLGSANPAALLTALANSNVRIRRWTWLNTVASGGGVHWGVEDLWGPPSAQYGPGPLSPSVACQVQPGTPTDWTIVPQPLGATLTPDIVELRMSPGLAQLLCLDASGSDEFKIEAWAWSSDSERWHADISTQSW
jgi:hypothetical protein